MKYKCKTIPIYKLITSYKGFTKSLCNSCKTEDCDNPIENRKVSVLGVNKDMRAYVKGNEISFVMFCEGYSQ